MDTAVAQPATAVDPEERARYDGLAATWWDPEGPMWPLHRLNALRVPFITGAVVDHFRREHGARALAGLSILDIGCGAGLLSEAMARAGARVTGVDPAARNIEIARAHADAGALDIEYLAGSVEQIAGRRFDVVLNMEVVEHVPDLGAFMQACGRCVDAGGMQVVSTINRNARSWLFAIVGAEYVLRWLPRGTHQWRRFVRPAELEAHLGDAQLSVVRRAGVGINPFTRAYRVTDDTRVNYMLVAVRHD